MDDRVVGGIGIEPRADIYQYSAEIGFWLSPPHWGRGVMTAAVEAVSVWAFAETDLVRLEAPVLAWNPASMRVLEKCGYTREGVVTDAAYKDGQWVDSVLYARLQEPA